MGDDKRWRAILLFGMPGSGKGTQGHAIGSLPGFLHISSGDIFRQLHRDAARAREVESYTSAGKLVPDELTIQIFLHHMELMTQNGQFKPEQQIIIADGIPRTFAQAKILASNLDVLRIFNLCLPDREQAVERIRQRALRSGRIDDANETVIRGRLVTFDRETADTLRFYDPSVVIEVDAAKSAIEVLADLSRQVALAVR